MSVCECVNYVSLVCMFLSVLCVCVCVCVYVCVCVCVRVCAWCVCVCVYVRGVCMCTVCVCVHIMFYSSCISNIIHEILSTNKEVPCSLQHPGVLPPYWRSLHLTVWMCRVLGAHISPPSSDPFRTRWELGPVGT